MNAKEITRTVLIFAALGAVVYYGSRVYVGVANKV